MTVPSDIANPAMANEGIRRIEWAEREMPVLRLIREHQAAGLNGQSGRALGNRGTARQPETQQQELRCDQPARIPAFAP